MDLSRRNPLCPCSRVLLGNKGQFYFQPKNVAIGIGPSYSFYLSPTAVLLLQNFLLRTNDHRYPALTFYWKPSKFTIDLYTFELYLFNSVLF